MGYFDDVKPGDFSGSAGAAAADNAPDNAPDAERFNFGLIADVFAVLEKHGYKRFDNAHTGQAVGILLDLAETYEGKRSLLRE